jgi:hypothetical protein
LKFALDSALCSRFPYHIHQLVIRTIVSKFRASSLEVFVTLFLRVKHLDHRLFIAENPAPLISRSSRKFQPS